MRKRLATLISISFDFLSGSGVPSTASRNLGVEHKGLQIVADGVDVDVPMDEVDGLGAEGVPEKSARSGRRLHRLVDLAQPAVVRLVRLQTRVGGERFPEAREVAVVGRETIAGRIVRQPLLGGDQSLVAGNRLQSGSIEAGQQLRRDDQDSQRIVRVTEAVKQPLLCFPVPPVGRVFVLAAVYVVTMSDVSGGSTRSSSCL